MKDLIRASLVLSKAIKPRTDIHHIHSKDELKTTIKFSDIKDGVNVVAFTFDKVSEDGSNTLCYVVKVSTLKVWLQANRDKIYVHLNSITIMRFDMVSWDFAKRREFNITFSDYNTEGMKQIVPNGLKKKSVEIRKGVFKDLLHNEETDTYFDYAWEYISTGKRGAFKDVEFYNAVEPEELIEYKVDC